MLPRRHLRPRPGLHRLLSETGVAVLRFELAVGETLDEHGHDVIELPWVESGRLDHRVDGRPFPGPPRSLLLVPRGHVHRYVVQERTVLWNVLLDPERLPVALPRPLARHLPRLLPGVAGPLLLRELDLADLLQRLHDEQQRQEPGWQAAAVATARLLLLLAARRCESCGVAETDAGDPRIEGLRRRLEERPAEPWTLARMAREAGLGISGMSRAFARRTGSTPLRYLRQARLRLAAERLAAGATLAQAAEAAGYGSAAALAHARARGSDHISARQRPGVVPVKALNRRWKTRGSDRPTRSAMLPTGAASSRSSRQARAMRRDCT